MSNWFAIAATFLLFCYADIPRVNSLRPSANPSPNISLGEDIPLFPPAASSGDEQNQPQAPTKVGSGTKSATLQETSKLSLIRFVSGEFAKAVKPLPAGKDGFLFIIGKPLNTEALDRAIATRGAAVSTGDNVQITKLDFRDHQIVVDLNGGGRGKHHWRDHLQIGMGGGFPVPTSTTTTQDTGPPGLQPGMGSTIFLEFNKPVPDLTPDELKQLLAPFLNFAKERSAAVQWFDTLPPDMKKAIQERKPVVGMDREEVVAAIGKPDHKSVSATLTATTSKTGFTVSPPPRPFSSASWATASPASSNSRNNRDARARPLFPGLNRLRPLQNHDSLVVLSFQRRRIQP